MPLKLIPKPADLGGMSRQLLFVLSLCASATNLCGQDVISATRVFTEPNGLRFFVDGTPYFSAQTFMWPAGSKHTLQVERDQGWFQGQRQKFSVWTDSANILNASTDTVVVTAHPSILSIKATFATEYLLRVLFSACTPVIEATCRPGGSVSLGGSPYTSDIEQWLAADTEITLAAFPNPGFVFNGWGPVSNNSTSFLYKHKMTGPALFVNLFAGGKRVRLLSEPPELMLAPDRTPARAPVEVDWAQGSRHVLGAVTPQADALNSSRIWIFSHWSNGMRINDVYTVANTNIPDSLTGHFVRGAQVSFVTNPPGLKVRIDGRDNWPAYNFVWGAGMKYQISAPAEQTDSRGRRYMFRGWSNGGPANQEITITDEHVANGFRLAANYEALSRLTIQTTPAGLPITIDGQECRSGCTFDRAEGSRISLSAAGSIPISDTSRFQFDSWSDGAAATRTFTFSDAASTSITANYGSYFRLSASAEPGNVSGFKLEPGSADGFYLANTEVMVTANDRPGFRFRRWEGDLSGSYRAGLVNMSVPRFVRAIFDPVPFVDEFGVRNAAAETPEPLVAPGSIAAIFGVNLARSHEQGPLNPLSQAIGGVTVRLDRRLLPLVFVSPEQINLQVPSDLPEGVYPLAVRTDNHPEVFSVMRVVRNAPGLFQKRFDNQTLAVALHEDGAEITPLSPARPGELITLFGTGFGPYDRPAPDGFPLPSDPPFTLTDAVEVLIGEQTVEIERAGGVAGQVGTAMVRLRLPAALAPTEGSISVRARVNGRESNSVLVRVE